MDSYIVLADIDIEKGTKIDNRSGHRYIYIYTYI